MSERSGGGPGTSVPTARVRFGLGFVCAAGFGVVFTLSGMVNLAVPEAYRLGSIGVTLLALAVMAACFVLLGRGRTAWWAAAAYLAGLASLCGFLLPGASADTSAAVATVSVIASLAIPSVLVALADRRLFPAVAMAAFVPVLAVAVAVSTPFGRNVFVGLAVTGGWVAMVFAGLWLAHSTRRAALGVGRLRQGYSEERQATEKEAELRYGARVLHDTVLATLTMIAHSGRGLAPAALRRQAADDSRLLEQLRTTGVVGVRPGGPGQLTARHPSRSTSTSTSSELHDAVDGWCEDRSFHVSWYGDPAVDAPERERDALVRAVLASLSNVLSHSGENSAEITVSHTDALVRAVVTDTGIGFDRALVPHGRLGVAESIEARMVAAGGSARVFSSPGHGTTVLLEVPR